VIELPNIMRHPHKWVEVLTTPPCANFDFYQLPAAERDRLVNKSLLDWGLGNHAESAAQATEHR
jgi:hypothetical protein